MKILIADSQLKVRHALFIWISWQPGCQIVGEAREAQELLLQLDALTPDVVILDHDLPGLPIAELVPRLRQVLPEVVIIMLTSAPLEHCQSTGPKVDYLISKVEPPSRMLEVIHKAGLTQGTPHA